MRRRGKIGRWAAEVILAYNQPSLLACIEEGDTYEEETWEAILDYIVDEGMEARSDRRDTVPRSASG